MLLAGHIAYLSEHDVDWVGGLAGCGDNYVDFTASDQALGKGQIYLVEARIYALGSGESYRNRDAADSCGYLLCAVESCSVENQGCLFGGLTDGDGASHRLVNYAAVCQPGNLRRGLVFDICLK